MSWITIPLLAALSFGYGAYLLTRSFRAPRAGFIVADRVRSFAWIYVGLRCLFDLLGRATVFVDTMADGFALSLLALVVSDIAVAHALRRRAGAREGRS